MRCSSITSLWFYWFARWAILALAISAGWLVAWTLAFFDFPGPQLSAVVSVGLVGLAGLVFASGYAGGLIAAAGQYPVIRRLSLRSDRWLLLMPISWGIAWVIYAATLLLGLWVGERITIGMIWGIDLEYVALPMLSLLGGFLAGLPMSVLLARRMLATSPKIPRAFVVVSSLVWAASLTASAWLASTLLEYDMVLAYLIWPDNLLSAVPGALLCGIVGAFVLVASLIFIEADQVFAKKSA